MKAIPQTLDDKLLGYLDNTLSPSEMLELQQQLEHDMALKARLDTLRKVHEALRQLKTEEPSRNFTQAVMGKLDHYPVRTGLSIRNGILLLVGVLVATGIVSYLLSGGVFDNATSPLDLNTMNSLPKEYFNKPLPSVYLDGKLMINIIILLNLGLAWVVLDRTILRPYFKRRMRAG